MAKFFLNIGQLLRCGMEVAALSFLMSISIQVQAQAETRPEAMPEATAVERPDADLPRLNRANPGAPVAPATQALPIAQPLPQSADASPANVSLIDSSYVLGHGDQLSLAFFNVPEYDGQRQIAVDGSLNLPLIGKLSVSGLTIESATQAISDAYAPYLKTPLVTIDLLLPRPVQVGIAGEVNKPGSYEIQLSSDGTSSVQWPTVIEAIQLAGGITNKADIREIEIRRAQASGASQTIRLNLWEVLSTGSIQSDITLRHGDAISVPAATSLTPGELTQLSAANFSPDSIRVTVVGEVPQPGTLEIVPNAPLNQAILAAGGFNPQRADSESIELVRLNADGTVAQRTIPISFDQGINDDTNPALQNNDVIVVGRSGRAAFSDNVDGVLGPFGAILSPFRLLLDLFN
jgi:polysaccharide biosynthesis/export protein